MQLSSRKRFGIAWLLLGSLAAGVCSLIWPAAHIGKESIPVGNDSFYHARRILDTAQDPTSFYEFDPKIHAPEGSLLVWPWGYDYAMGWIVRIGMKLGLASEPIDLLVWIPVAAVFISIGLIMLIVRRLALPLWCSVLAALCVALSPLTQYLHGVGFVDHHFAEYIFVLASIAAGLAWFSNLQSTRAAICLGIALGIAPAVHNALFILQIPILITLFIYWPQKHQAPARSVAFFSAGLIASTTLILLPSLPFRMGIFEFYLLSWFHLYVACGTALCCWFLSRYSFNAKNFGILVVIVTALFIPLAYQIGIAGSFLTGTITRLQDIGEMQSPRQLSRIAGPLYISNRYSLFIWLAPATYFLCLLKLWKSRQAPALLFWVCAVCGLTLLLMQFRLHYFGSFAFCIPWLVAIHDFTDKRFMASKPVILATTLAILLMHAPGMRNELLGPMTTANDQFFLNLRGILFSLRDNCAKDPGIVLADHDAGHFIRYYSECSVISNNFLLTQQHENKIHEMERLLDLSAAELPNAKPLIKYVLVRPLNIAERETGIVYMGYSEGANNLVTDLLLGPYAAPPQIPPANYILLQEKNLLDEAFTNVPYARLYKIKRDSDMENITVPVADNTSRH